MLNLITFAVPTFLLWYMQIIPPTISLDKISAENPVGAVITAVNYFLYQFRWQTGLAASLFLVFLNIKASVWGPRKTSQAIIYNQLKVILEDCFKNRFAQTRITVFKKVSWAEALTHYFFHRVLKDFKSLLGVKALKTAICQTPTPSNEYLIIFSRYGSPNQSTHSTLFKIPEDYEEMEGVVGLAWKNQNSVGPIELPNIRNIQNLKEISKTDELTAIDQKTVKDYMEKGNIRKLSKLQSIHRHSVSMWASLIHDAGNDPWGVIIVDCSEKNLLNKGVSKQLEGYAQGIRKIISRNPK